ncbi:hypothetical protein HMPREF9455_01359 [Dysgonomonas gadei ATCC BAA-286]|uniref:Uncharacterized protein n=2 Tax=Dysgonomonadaceae TaxID=2005520 RepID=F5IV59_9BACT|nr:hypothetical protein HMPREF9455_01359 [Dysgonomonas gadei ATCC BAA-286]
MNKPFNSYLCMNKRFLNVLLCGVMLFSTGIFSSCGEDVDDLKSRVSVLEVAVADLKDQLSNAMTTGATIVKVEEANGTYTLTLSDGKVITIKPGTGSGANITVEKNEKNVIITVDETEYVLPIGSAVNSLIYSPETTDGIVNIGNTSITVNFLATPAITSANLESATFDIAEAHQLKVGGNGLFKVDGDVTLEGDFIKVPIKALGVEASKSYAVAIYMTINGTTAISSNYFTVKVSDDYSFNSEELVTPTFSNAITDATEVSPGFWTATLPETDAVSFLNEFNFNTLVSLPSINAADLRFELGVKANQNGNVQDRYDFLKSCLTANGAWKMQGRPGSNFNKKEGDAKPDGVLINVVVNDVIKAKIYWKVIDPLANIDFHGGLVNFSEHMEYGNPGVDGTGVGEGEGIIVNPGVNSIDLARTLIGGKLSLVHGNGMKFLNALKAYSVKLGEEDLVMSDGTKLVVTNVGKKYTKFSRGLNWFNIQTSIAKSQRRNWTMSDDEKKALAQSDCNGEIVTGWDGLPGEDMTAKGLNITSDGFFKTTTAYGGWALRVGMGLEFEYDYGMKPISNGCLVFLWINRRTSAENVVDVAPR